MSATEQPAPIQVGAAPGVERHILRFGLLALFAGVTVYFAVSEPSFRSSTTSSRSCSRSRPSGSSRSA